LGIAAAFAMMAERQELEQSDFPVTPLPTIPAWIDGGKSWTPHFFRMMPNTLPRISTAR